MMNNSKHYTDESSLVLDDEWEEISLTNRRQDPNSWEVLSEMESVWSLDLSSSSVSSIVTNPIMSYKDALLCEGGVVDHHERSPKTCLGKENTKKKKKKRLTYRKEMEKEKENNEMDDFGFDAFQMMEGVKCGRGRKMPQHLKNDQRTKNHPRNYHRTRDANRMYKICPKDRMNSSFHDFRNSCVHDIRVWVLFNEIKRIRSR